MILFDVTLETTAEQRKLFVELLARTVAESQREAGCLIYRCTADLDSPLRFYLVELWHDEAALMAHAQGSAFRSFLAQLASCGRIVSSIARSGSLQPYSFKRPS